MRGFLAGAAAVVALAAYLAWGFTMLLADTARPRVDYAGLAFAATPFVVGFAVRRVTVRRRRVEREDRRQRFHEARLELTRAEQPELWALVERTARACRVEPPASVELRAGANATVLKYGRSHPPRLTLGVPLLLGMTVDELTAVLAHEFRHVRRGPRLRLTRRRDERSPRRRLRLALARREELACDAAGARVAGAAAMASALRTWAEWGWAEQRYSADYLRPGVEGGVRPRQLYRGLAALFAEPSRAAERAEFLQALLAGPEDPSDTHPGLARRLAVLGSAPEASAARPALELLRDVDGVLDRAAELLLPAEVVKARPLDWDEYFHVAGRIANSRVALALSVQIDSPGNLAQVLGLWERGGLPESGVRAVVLGALAASGHVRWVADWSGPLRAVRADGSPLPEGEVAGLVALVGELGVPVNHVPVFG